MTAPPRLPARQAARDLSPATRDALAEFGLSRLEYEAATARMWRRLIEAWEPEAENEREALYGAVDSAKERKDAARAAAEAALAAERERGDGR